MSSSLHSTLISRKLELGLSGLTYVLFPKVSMDKLNSMTGLSIKPKSTNQPQEPTGWFDEILDEHGTSCSFVLWLSCYQVQSPRSLVCK